MAHMENFETEQTALTTANCSSLYSHWIYIYFFNVCDDYGYVWN